MELETIIGLEIHAQLSTKSKLFCGCDNDAFGATPNTRVCPVCMGFPGMLPVLNEEAVDKGRRAAAALGCEIQEFSKFDRKNYFYPDLPNGFQISQFDKPIALKGKVKIEFDGKSHNIGITRVHLENDAGKLTHVKDGTLCDYNRSGTPLIEIVTDPDIRSAEEAQVLAKEIQKIIRFVGASDADMEKGMMRFDASISMRKKGADKLHARTEIKNLNSFASLIKALKYEEKRQSKLWEKKTPQEIEVTAGWLDEEEKTKIMREKESANDYRYFPEPDLPPLIIDAKSIEEIQQNIPELPLEKLQRYKKEFELSEQDSLKLAESIELSTFFEESTKLSKDPKKTANIILTVVLAKTNWNRTEITPQHIADVLTLLEREKVSSTGGKEILAEAMKSGESAESIMQELNLGQVSDDGDLEAWVEQVLNENSQSVEDLKNGKDKALQFLMGQVMKLSGGSANPPKVLEILKSKISEQNV